MATETEVKTGWRPIETAPDGTVIVADENAENIAVAHWRTRSGWMLGRSGSNWCEALDFSPAWWLPRDYQGNPFKAALRAVANQQENNDGD